MKEETLRFAQDDRHLYNFIFPVHINAQKNFMKKKTQNRQKQKAAPGLSWGFRSLDRHTAGLLPSQMTVFAAHPGVGKTAFALNVAEKLALEQNIPVGMVSLEMTRKQLLVRMACSHARIDLLQLYLGKGSEKAREKFTNALGVIEKAPLHIFETPRISLPDLQTEARRLKSRFQIRLLIIDFLQLMSAEGLPPCKDRPEELMRIAQGIQLLAGELQLPVLLLQRLDHPEEKVTCAQKTIHSREAKAIEKEADVICRLTPNDAYEEQQRKAMEPITAEVMIVKNRNGPVGRAKLKFLPKNTRFEDV